jgi:hypothetical protein
LARPHADGPRPRVVVVIVGGWCRANDATAVVAGGSTTALASLAALSGGAMTRTALGVSEQDCGRIVVV